MLRSLMILLASASFASANPLQPFEKEAHAEWKAIGRVNHAGYRTRRMCSGTLISPQAVITAAHCVVKADQSPHNPADIIFVAGWLAGNYAESSPAKAITLHPDALVGGQTKVTGDIALIELAKPLSVPPVPIALPPSFGDFALLGYTDNLPHKLSGNFGCFGTTRRDLLILECPVRPGNSGGPVLMETPEGWRVIGVISATDGHRTFATPVDAFLSP